MLPLMTVKGLVEQELLARVIEVETDFTLEEKIELLQVEVELVLLVEILLVPLRVVMVVMDYLLALLELL
jgi:hypothetical protein